MSTARPLIRRRPQWPVPRRLSLIPFAHPVWNFNIARLQVAFHILSRLHIHGKRVFAKTRRGKCRSGVEHVAGFGEYKEQRVRASKRERERERERERGEIERAQTFVENKTDRFGTRLWINSYSFSAGVANGEKSFLPFSGTSRAANESYSLLRATRRGCFRRVDTVGGTFEWFIVRDTRPVTLIKIASSFLRSRGGRLGGR